SPRGAPVTPSGQREANLTIGDTLITTAPVLKPILADHRAWIASKNLENYTQQVKMAILDTGFDTASDDGVPASFHPDFRMSDGSGTFVTVKRYTTGPGLNADCSGHGTFVAGVLAGNAGVPLISTETRDCPYPCSDAPYLMGVGVVPEIPLVVGRVFNYLASNPTPRGFVNQDFTTIFSDLASQGVAITSNSWNRANDTDYDEDTEKLDKLVRSASGSNNGPPMAMYFSAGNRDDATNGNQYVSWPAIAKNVITVGASENFNPSSYTDYPPSNGYANADNGNEIWIYSQQGPTRPAGVDNRIKPDLVAPGSGMESPATRNDAFGTNSCCIGSCTLPTETVRPVGAVIDSTSGQGHLWSRGTSFATPAAAGAGALLYTWFRNKNVTPRPSLLKAAQISLARPLTGTGQLPPGDKQGWGKADLTRLPRSSQPSDPYEWNNEDTVVNPFMTATLPSPGGSYRILDATQPVRITAVWTDAPGDPGAGRELVNDLDLTVRIHGAAGYFALGNNFAASGRSTIFVTGVSSGTPDTRNNVEQVVFLAAEAGDSMQFHVELFGREIMKDGIGVWPPTGPLQQDFALFIENAVAVPAGAAVFNTVAPCRVLDTRDPDGPYGGPALTGNTIRSFALWNRCGISPTAKAVSVNLTTVIPDADGYITAFPGGTPQPNVSTMNYRTGRVRANNAILSLGVTGQISVFASAGTTHFVLDVNGYFD
ncbi:MAG TPA: S8 family serine peptidase, partial [Bryobacteraceae bacterium]|nr:S8 family serine peptidase [Bryobacteraceae bacterium]